LRPRSEEIQSDPARYLNPIYLSVMFAQNGSAILIAMLSAEYFGDLGITLVSVGFTLTYFVLVEAMSKTFGILHSGRAARTRASGQRESSAIFSEDGSSSQCGLENDKAPGTRTIPGAPAPSNSGRLRRRTGVPTSCRPCHPCHHP